MRSAMSIIAAGVLAGGIAYSPGKAPEFYSYAGKKCVAAGGVSVVLGGVKVGTVSDADFATGSSCTVIPPDGVANSIALRCYVDDANTAHIVASTAVALGVSQGAATWCVEVRTVAPGFVE